MHVVVLCGAALVAAVLANKLINYKAAHIAVIKGVAQALELFIVSSLDVSCTVEVVTFTRVWEKLTGSSLAAVELAS